jgi:hypothetical protein
VLDRDGSRIEDDTGEATGAIELNEPRLTAADSWVDPQ